MLGGGELFQLFSCSFTDCSVSCGRWWMFFNTLNFQLQVFMNYGSERILLKLFGTKSPALNGSISDPKTSKWQRGETTTTMLFVYLAGGVDGSDDKIKERVSVDLQLRQALKQTWCTITLTSIQHYKQETKHLNKLKIWIIFSLINALFVFLLSLTKYISFPRRLKLYSEISLINWSKV